MDYGETCIGEFVQYKFTLKNNAVQCKNNPNSCERALCECDAQFARDHVVKKDVFDPQYHLFWSTNDGGDMWDPKDNCARGFGIPYIPQDEISILKKSFKTRKCTICALAVYIVRP